MRVRDAQATIRRQTLKRRDDPVDGFLLVTAATRTNRRVLAEFTVLLPDVQRLRTQLVLEALENGQHPPSGIILIRSFTAPGHAFRQATVPSDA